MYSSIHGGGSGKKYRLKRSALKTRSFLTRKSVDEIPDESAEVVLDLPDAGHEVLVALALQVQPGDLDVVRER